MDMRERINAALKEAMKAKDAGRLSTLRLISAAIKDREIAARGDGEDSAKRGGLSMLLFIGLVALGLPLLAGGRGGLGVFVSPTAGFVVGFPVAAYVTGLVMQNLRVDAMIASGIASLIGGIVVLYVMGIGGFWMLTDKGLMASITIMATYIPGDLVKVVLTAIVVGALVKARPQSLLSRQ